MKPESMKKLAGASNPDELRAAIGALCRPFGSVKEIRVVLDLHGTEYVCFVVLDSPGKNSAMIEQLGGTNYGYSVAFNIPSDPAKR
jgi:hypothetical protein